jgi:uncharacterized protein
MHLSRTTLVIGASTNINRYSNICIRELAERNFPIEALGKREGSVAGIVIKTGKPDLSCIHTVTLYLGAQNQPEFYQYIINLKPERVIFNPGTENPQFEKLLTDAGIEFISACSIVMLHTGEFFEDSAN